MSRYFLVEIIPPAPADYPLQPFCRIVVGNHSEGGNDPIRLSSLLGTDQEIDHSVNRLIADLKSAGVDAKKRLAKANKDQLAHIKR